MDTVRENVVIKPRLKGTKRTAQNIKVKARGIEVNIIPEPKNWGSLLKKESRLRS